MAQKFKYDCARLSLKSCFCCTSHVSESILQVWTSECIFHSCLGFLCLCGAGPQWREDLVYQISGGLFCLGAPPLCGSHRQTQDCFIEDSENDTGRKKQAPWQPDNLVQEPRLKGLLAQTPPLEFTVHHF
jgi:hypothetical protein